MPQVGYYHLYKDGVDYVFIDHPCYHNAGKNIYTSGSRLDLGFRCVSAPQPPALCPWTPRSADAAVQSGAQP